MAITLSTIASGTGGFVLLGEDPADQSGFSVALVGDINGDGFADLLIGAPYADSAGDAYVVFGRAPGFDATIDLTTIAAGSGGFVLRGEDAGDLAGWSLAAAGDINGDGIADMIIGARDADGAANLASGAGAAYVVFGTAGGFTAGLDLAAVAAGNGGFVIQGQDGTAVPNGFDTPDGAGGAVASAGDVNGDGFDDLIVGASGADGANNTLPGAGAAYVIYGQAGSFGPSVSLASIAAGTGGFVIQGNTSADELGWSVTAAGDLNGDGLGDFAIGAHGLGSNSGGKIGTGKTYVVFGQPGGFPAGVNLSDIEQGIYPGVLLLGEDSGDEASRALASAGDFNGDGFADLAIGAPQADGDFNTVPGAGEAYVVFGGPNFGSGGPPRTLGSVTNAGIGGIMLRGAAGNDYAGTSLSSAGDVNGDGFDDLIVGAKGVDGAGGPDAGAAYLVFGRAGGFGNGVIELSAIAAGTGGLIIRGEDGGDLAGSAVSGGRDIDGDGYDDLVVGAPQADGLNNLEGAAGGSYVIFGSNLTGAVTHSGTTGADSLLGTAGADAMVGGRGNDTLDGGTGGADALTGGAGDDRLVISSTAFQRVDGGTGADTLVLGGAAGLTLDLTRLGTLRLQSIEAIDLGGAPDHTLRLSSAKLLALSEASNTLRVFGDAGDRVELTDSGWVRGSVVSGVRSFTKGQAVLAVDAAVAVASTVPIPAIDLGSMAASTGFVLRGRAIADHAGWSVATAGDINGDGFADLLVGAYGYDGLLGSNPGGGGTYVVFGKAGAWDAATNLAAIATGTTGFVIDGDDNADKSGWSVSAAGDVNGDGFADIIVGAPGADGPYNARDSAGDSFVVFGKAGGFDARVDLTAVAAGTGGFVIRGEGAGDESGRSVAAAGDINGDGFGDLIIGAPFADGALDKKSGSGDSYVVFGQANWPAKGVDLAAVTTGAGGFVLRGVGGNNRAGWSVSSAGDLNGDGFDDLVAGAPYASGDAVNAAYTRPNAGRSYVVFGKATGWSAEIDISAAASGTGGFSILGEDGGDVAGRWVASAGDVDGDGIADLIIGAPGGDGTGNALGQAGDSYVVFGKTGGWDPTVDLGLVAQGTGGFVIHGRDAVDNSGTTVSSAGDVNGDGIDDLLIGAPLGDGPDNSRGDSGEVYVVFGTADDFGAAVDLTAVASGNGGFVIYGKDSQDYAGAPVAAAGDLDGDGFDDLIIGASNARAGVGDAYVIFGRDFSFAVTKAGGDDNDSLMGDGYHDDMVGGRGNDTLVGAGGLDVLIGGAGDDVLAISDLGFRRVDGGTGTDTLRLDCAGVVLDLHPISALRLHSVEVVDITGSGANTLTLKAIDPLRFSELSNGLTVTGGADDLVAVADAKSTNGSESGGFRHVTLGGGVLHVALAMKLSLTGTVGADSLKGWSGAEVLQGGGRNDKLFGEGGNDTLDGGAGADSLAGGAGDDLYVVNLATDSISELANEGRDTVSASVSWTLGGNLEVLVLTGTAKAGTGNALDNTITGIKGASLLSGGDGNDVLYGDDLALTSGGNDTLHGDAGTDTLFGGLGADQLDGGLGADSMVGGAGNDIYFVDDPGDGILELSAGGVDEVRSAIDWTLGAELEKLTLLTGALNGSGNTLNNTIIGNSDNNLLQGLAGADVLLGNAGADTLIGSNGPDTLEGGAGRDSLDGGSQADLFRWMATTHGNDTIAGFATGSDHLGFSAAAFAGGLTEGIALTEAQFQSGTTNAATSVDVRFLYNTATGVLRYDVDGSGAELAKTIATFLPIAPSLTPPVIAASDIVILA